MLLSKDPYKTDLTDTFHLVEILLVLRTIATDHETREQINTEADNVSLNLRGRGRKSM